MKAAEERGAVGTPAAQTEKWKILVVDDEEDVHVVTGLALKRRAWKGRPFELTAARSAAEARNLLDLVGPFHVNLVDVVMENDHAGLDLCEYIRATQPRWRMSCQFGCRVTASPGAEMASNRP